MRLVVLTAVLFFATAGATAETVKVSLLDVRKTADWRDTTLAGTLDFMCVMVPGLRIEVIEDGRRMAPLDVRPDSDYRERAITLDVTDLPVRQILDRIMEQSRATWRETDDGVVVVDI